MQRITSPGRRTVLVLANRRAGTILQQGEAQFTQTIHDAFKEHGAEATVSFCNPADIPQQLKRAMADPAHTLIVVAGGDGTIHSILETLLTSRRAIGILPLGTLNVLGRNLGMSDDLAANAAILLQGIEHEVDIVTVNGVPFHSNAGMGWLVTMASARSEMRRRLPFSRQLGFVLAVMRTMLRSRAIEIAFETSTGLQTALADAVLVTNNRVDGGPWQRQKLDDGVFELHVVRAPTVAARFRLLFAVARGTWRELPHIDTITSTHVSVTRRRRRSARVAMDGELRRMHNPLEFHIKPRAVRFVAGPLSEAETLT